MQYEVIKVENSNDGLTNYIAANHLSHLADSTQTGVTILGISESYNINTERVLTDKGFLFVYIGIEDNQKVYHLYNLFKDPSNVQFKHVLIINEPVDSFAPSYENMHRVVLYKHAASRRYLAQPIYYGKEGDKYVYSLDMDGFVLNNTEILPDNDGLFRLNTNTGLANGIINLLVSYKQFMHFNVSADSPTLDPGIEMVFRDLAGNQINISSYRYKNSDNYYIDDSTNDDDVGLNLTTNPYLIFSIEIKDGVEIDNLPDQLLLEVY